MCLTVCPASAIVAGMAPPSPPAHFADVLLGTARVFDETAQAICNAEAGERIARPAVMRLLPHLSGDGIRPTDLARRVDVSKQAVGQTLADLEARGYVEYVADASDGRARVVRLTRAGREAMAIGIDVLARLEAAVAARVGRRRLDTLAADLAAVLDVLHSGAITAAALGPPATARPARRGRPAAVRRAAAARPPRR
jgi:DNA-binding MarR family transcriptional regulator